MAPLAAGKLASPPALGESSPQQVCCRTWSAKLLGWNVVKSANLHACGEEENGDGVPRLEATGVASVQGRGKSP